MHVLVVQLERPAEARLGLLLPAAVPVDAPRHEVPGPEVGQSLHPLPGDFQRLLELSGAAVRVGERGEGAAVRIPVGPEQGAELSDLDFDRFGHGRSGIVSGREEGSEAASTGARKAVGKIEQAGRGGNERQGGPGPNIPRGIVYYARSKS